MAVTPQLINVGTTANDGTGDRPRPMALKYNATVTALAAAINSVLSSAGSSSGGTGSSTSAPAISGVSVDGSTIAATTASPYQMTAADRVVDVIKTSGAPTRLILPTSPTLWVDYTVIDGRSDAATNNITIAAPSGASISGAATVTIGSNGAAVTLRAVSQTIWRVTA